MTTFRKIIAVAAVAAAALGAVVLATGRAGAESAPAPGNATAVLHVEGMTCPSCKIAVRMAFTRLGGVKGAKVDVARKSAAVDYDPARVTPPELVEAVNRAGYQASLPAKGGP